MELVKIFSALNNVNVEEHIENKNGLRYLSWAWAWSEVKKVCPTAKSNIYENLDGRNYFTAGKTCWVKTGVDIEGLEYIEYLPIMDYKNRSIPLDQVTSMDVNKTIQRSLTKACARHGLGLYVYAGEDLPEKETNAIQNHPYYIELHKMLKGQNNLPAERVLQLINERNNKPISQLTEDEWGKWKKWVAKKLTEIANKEYAKQVHSEENK